MSIDVRLPARLHFMGSLLILAVAPVCAVAQSIAQNTSPDTLAPTIDIFSRHDAVTAAVFMLGTAAIMPLDRRIAEQSQRASLQDNTVLNHTMTTARVIGEPGAIVLAGATYLYGRSAESPRSAELGLRTIESIGAAGITSLIIKGVVGRARPYVVSDTNPHDYKFGRGFRDDKYTSFPSGHVTTAFAAASAASQEIPYLWPHASNLWTPVLFTTASLVGVARVYEDKHWASDVIAGAAVGTVVSRIVVKYARSHPRNAIDRLLLPVGVSQARASRGTLFSWNYRF